MTNQEMIDLVIETFDGVVIDDYGWEHHKISGKPYDIRFDRSRLEWACDCKAFQFRHKFRKRYCKHIEEVQSRLLSQRSGRAGARVV
tara:strand:- start:2268 stop:2528 length:261 start_codon:yes stop_codon:yes gene_type:complete